MAAMCIPVRVPPGTKIGDAVAKMLSGAQTAETNARCHVVAVVPRLITYSGQWPTRYEVTEADVILEWRPL